MNLIKSAGLPFSCEVLNRIRTLLMVMSTVALSSCDKSSQLASADPGWIRLNSDRVDLECRLSIARMKLNRLESRSHEQEAANALLNDLTTRQIRLLDRQIALEREIKTTEDAMLSMKARHLELSRELAVGMEFSPLRTISGRSYDQAKIIRVTDAGIQIRHATGTARLLFQDLSDAQRHQFGLDEGLAIAALKTEASLLRTYEAQIGKQLAEQSLGQSATPASPAATRRQIAKPISAFDRFVSLGSTSRKPRQVVARYNPSHRPTTYFYIPSSPRAACSP